MDGGKCGGLQCYEDESSCPSILKISLKIRVHLVEGKKEIEKKILN